MERIPIHAPVGTAPVFVPDENLATQQPLDLPLSDVQRGIWHVQHLAPASSACNAVFAARVVSPIDVAAFKAALHALTTRHAVLRSRFIADEAGVPRQQIQPDVKADIALITAVGWNEETLRRNVLAESREPFDLARAPLLRTTLYRRRHDDAILVWRAHRIVVDLWSLAVLLDEFRELYAAYAAGLEPCLPPIESEYLAFIRDQREISGSNEHWNYWRARLGGDLPLLNLAPDYPRPPLRRYRGASLSFMLDGYLTAALHALARVEGVTLHVLMLAAYYALLHRYTGQDDILVGSPVAGRPGTHYRRTVGQFVNTVVLRGAVDGRMHFVELLHRTRDTVAAAVRHQEFPFTVLVERLLPQRDLSRPPLFQAAFSWESLPPFSELASFFSAMPPTRESLTFGALRIQPFLLPQAEGQTEIELDMGGERDGCLSGTWKYDSDLFTPETIAAFSARFAELLKGIAADPNQPVARLRFLTAAERDQVLVEWNPSVCILPTAQTIHELIEQQALRTPDKTAVSDGEQVYSYRVLNHRANQLAHYLVARGTRAGELIGLATARKADSVVAMLAVLKAGAAFVPLDPTSSRERLRMMVEDAGVSRVLTHERVWAEMNVPSVQAIQLDRDWTGIITYPSEDPSCVISPESTAYVTYTEDSTGKAHGVDVPHRSVSNLLAAMARTLGMQSNDVMLAIAALSVDMAVFELLLPLTVGATSVIAGREAGNDAPKLEALLQQSGATMMQATPTTWRRLLANGWKGKTTLTALCGGEALPRPLADALLPRVAALWNLYGMPEATVWSTLARVESGNTTVVIGKPIDNTHVYVLDQAMQPVPPGVAGELYLGGCGLARGYLHRPALTTEKFVANPFIAGERIYKTGDLARWRHDGNLECLGHLSQETKPSSVGAESSEYEHILIQRPEVQQCDVTTDRRDENLRRSPFDEVRTSRAGLASTPQRWTSLVQ